MANKTEIGAVERDGQVYINVAGGTPPYSFKWSHENETSSFVSNLVPGSYFVTVTDANGCTTDLTATVPLLRMLKQYIFSLLIELTLLL